MNTDFKSAVTLLTEKMTHWYELGIKLIPNILVALIVFLLFMLMANITKKLVHKFLPKISKNKAIVGLLESISSFIVLAFGLFIALEIMNLDKTVTSILAGAGVIGLALGFAFQEIAANFVSGILIAIREPYQLGDIVEIETYLGEVTKITLRTTSITTFQGLEVIIPNKSMFTKAFINYTTTPDRRLDLSVGVSYGDDLKKVEQVTLGVLEGIDHRTDGREVEVYFEEFGSSSINLSARVWVKYPGHQNYLKARHQLIMNLKSAFDENNITIPFPIRTLDFGIKGGKELSDMNICNV